MAIKHNLLSHVDKGDDGGGQSLPKILFLLFVSLVSAGSSGWFLQKLFEETSLMNLVFFLVSSGVFLGWFLVSALFIQDTIWILGGCLLSFAALLSFNYENFSVGVLASGLMAGTVFFLGALEVRRDSSSLIKIRFFRLARVFLAPALISFSLVCVSAFYFANSGGELVLSSSSFAKLIQPVESLVKGFFPSFSLDQSVGGAASILGVGSGDTFGDILYKVLVKDLAESDTPPLRYLPGLILIFSGFLFVRSFSIPFGWGVSLVSHLFYISLLALNFASIQLESTDREVIVMK